jgi:hypothetical protein
MADRSALDRVSVWDKAIREPRLSHSESISQWPRADSLLGFCHVHRIEP